MVRHIPASLIKYLGRRLEGEHSEAALRKGFSPRRRRPALPNLVNVATRVGALPLGVL